MAASKPPKARLLTCLYPILYTLATQELYFHLVRWKTLRSYLKFPHLPLHHKTPPPGHTVHMVEKARFWFVLLKGGLNCPHGISGDRVSGFLWQPQDPSPVKYEPKGFRQPFLHWVPSALELAVLLGFISSLQNLYWEGKKLLSHADTWPLLSAMQCVQLATSHRGVHFVRLLIMPWKTILVFKDISQT